MVVVFCVAWLPSGLMGAEPCAQSPLTRYATGEFNPECATVVHSANTFVSPFLIFAIVVAVSFPVLWLLATISNRKHLRPGRDRSDPARRVTPGRNPMVIDESGAAPLGVERVTTPGAGLGTAAAQRNPEPFGSSPVRPCAANTSERMTCRCIRSS